MVGTFKSSAADAKVEHMGVPDIKLYYMEQGRCLEAAMWENVLGSGERCFELGV